MKKQILLLLVIMSLSLTLVSAAITGSETMTRTASSSVAPGATFSVTYTAQGATGTWGASIQDSVTGGCTFPAGTSLKTVMLSDEGTTKTVTVTAPSSGTCTFTGDYQYGSMSVKAFSNTVVTVGGTCSSNCACATSTCTGQTCPDGCGGTCPGTKTTGCTTCTPDNSCQATTCTTTTCTNNCGTVLTGTKDCGTGENPFCEVASKANWFKVTDSACTNGIVTILAIIVGITLLISFTKR